MDATATVGGFPAWLV
jgi:hypothetical protein